MIFPPPPLLLKTTSTRRISEPGAGHILPVGVGEIRVVRGPHLGFGRLPIQPKVLASCTLTSPCVVVKTIKHRLDPLRQASPNGPLRRSSTPYSNNIYREQIQASIMERAEVAKAIPYQPLMNHRPLGDIHQLTKTLLQDAQVLSSIQPSRNSRSEGKQQNRK
jgi:hypothetical protein